MLDRKGFHIRYVCNASSDYHNKTDSQFPSFNPLATVHPIYYIKYNNNNNHRSTALYGLGPPLSEVTWSAHLWQFGDQPTGRAVQLNPDVTATAIWQSGRRLGWEMAAKFGWRNISIHARKVLLHAVNLRHGTDGFTSPPKEDVLRNFIGIEPANLGSSGEHANH
jgi:hypothetical protein